MTGASRTPLERLHRAQAARLTECGGWQLPAVYSNAEKEQSALHDGVALVDLSACAKVSLLGEGVGDAVATLGIPSGLEPRRAAWLGQERTGLACWLTPDSLLLLATSPNGDELVQPQSAVSRVPRLVRHELTSAYAAFGLLGPQSDSLLQRFCSANVTPSAFPPGTCMETNFAGVQAALVRPDGVAVPFVWLCVAWDVGEYLWQTLRDARAEPVGTEAWQKVIDDRPGP